MARCGVLTPGRGRGQVDLLGLSEGILAEIKPVGTFRCTAL